MKIGIAGPIDLKLLNIKERPFPRTYNYPLTSYLINGLMEKGHEVVAFTVSGDIDNPVSIKVSDQLTICLGISDKRPGRRFFRTEIDSLRHLMQQEKPDIVHAHWTYEFALAAIKSGLPNVATIHDNAFMIMKHNFDPYRLVRWIMNYQAIEKADKLIANSDYIYRILKGKNKTKARVIYNFYPDALIKSAMENKTGNKYLVTVSHDFNKTKNIENALKAFAMLRLRYPDLEYYLIGTNMKVQGSAHRYALKHNLADGAIFVGPKSYDETLAIVSGAFAMLHPSREESFGMSVLEGIILGVPAVGGKDSGNIPYLLEQGKAGIICDIEKPQEIAEGVIKLMEDESFYHELRRSAREMVIRKYSEKRIIDEHINYYKDILLSKTKRYARGENVTNLKWGFADSGGAPAGAV